jgi:hypothetical protein
VGWAARLLLVRLLFSFYDSSSISPHLVSPALSLSLLFSRPHRDIDFHLFFSAMTKIRKDKGIHVDL